MSDDSSFARGAPPGPALLAFRPVPAPPLDGPGVLRKLASPYGLAPSAFAAPPPLAPIVNEPSTGDGPETIPMPERATSSPGIDAEDVAPPPMLGPIQPAAPAAPIAPPALLNAALPVPPAAEPPAPLPSTPWAREPVVDASRLPSAALRPIEARTAEEPERPRPPPPAPPVERSGRGPVVALVALLALLAIALVAIVLHKKSSSNDPISIALANGAATDDTSAAPSASASAPAAASAKPKLFGPRPKTDEDPYDQAERELRANEKKTAPSATPTATSAAKDRLGI